MTLGSHGAARAPVVLTEVVGAFQENCYLLVDPSTPASVLIDPGADGEQLVALVERAGAPLEAIWLTHAHVDHVGGIAEVRQRWQVPIYLHPLDEPLYRAAGRQAALYGLFIEDPPPADRALGEGEVLVVGGLEFSVMHTPGHAPGHVVIHGHGIAFVGDCLFAGSVGRTDLPLSNPRDLVASLDRITSLPGETVAYPGHGPATTIDAERRTNPFLTGAARILGG